MTLKKGRRVKKGKFWAKGRRAWVFAPGVALEFLPWAQFCLAVPLLSSQNETSSDFFKFFIKRNEIIFKSEFVFTYNGN